jgi:hypothetical protein
MGVEQDDRTLVLKPGGFLSYSPVSRQSRYSPFHSRVSLR